MNQCEEIYIDNIFKMAPKNIITSDYEKQLRKAIKNILNPQYINRCYFHFSKCIWKKCREYGLTDKNFKKDSIVFSFCLKNIFFC